MLIHLTLYCLTCHKVHILTITFGDVVYGFNIEQVSGSLVS